MRGKAETILAISKPRTVDEHSTMPAHGSWRAMASLASTMKWRIFRVVRARPSAAA